MKKALSLGIVVLMLLGAVPAMKLVSALYGTKLIDGNLSEWTASDLIATGVPSGIPGADLDRLYVAWDDQYLYIAIKTNNTAKYWPDYGIAIDIDPGSGNGGTTDPWAKNIQFSGQFLPDYIIYAEAQDGQIVWMGMHDWTGSGWGSMGNVKDIGDYAYTGGDQGIQTIEIKIPWSALGGKPEKIGIIAWAAGNNDGDSAVDTLPVDPAIDYSNINSEWTDPDTLTNFAVIYVGTKTIDGDLSDWSDNEIAGQAQDNGLDGAKLDKLYVSWDDQYLYVAIKTNNTANWGLSYGVGIDVDPASGNGYTGTSDAWGKSISFGNGFAVDYELYGWWNDGAGRLEFNFGENEGMQLIKYENGGWSYDWQNNFPGYLVSYTGDTSTGLQTIEIRIPWDALGGKRKNFAVIAWITGGSGSAVSSAPWDPTLEDNPDEWGDADTFTSLASLELFIPKPELTVSVSSDVLDVERWQPANITLKVKNMGEVDAKNVAVHLYDNDNLIKSWLLNISANSEAELSYLYTYSSAWGTHTLKAVVDPDNEIEEVNENNNVDTVNIEVGRVAKTQNDMVKMGVYVWPKLYMPKYNKTLEMVNNLSNMSLPGKYGDQIEEFKSRLNESMQLYTEGNKFINMPHYELSGAMKIFSAYSRLLRLQMDINEFLENLKFKKKIDGLLNDWNETSLVAHNKVAFGAGAHLDSLYVDYDDSYLYIGLKTENTETWRIAYGIGLDYKDGGYTGDTDAWDRKIGFERGIDAEIYFYWNGPFFGEEGSNTITKGKIALWNGANWTYYPAFKNASIKYVGGDKGLQTLEMAIPWELLGGKPEKVYISVWIAGANPGDSAVNSLPDDPSMHDSGNEWGDQDTISTFAEVLIK